MGFVFPQTGRRAVLLTLFSNLLPVVFAAIFGWSLLDLMLLYWAENVIVGVINVAKMIAAGVTKGRGTIAGLFFYLPFFIFHYGMFCAVHGVLILVLFNGEPQQSVDDPFQLPGIFLHELQGHPFLALNVALLAVYHLYLFTMEWLRSGAWRNITPYEQMFMPYGRIIVVHVAVLLGGFAASFIGTPLVAVVLLALLKTVLETSAAEIAATDAENREV